MMRGSEFNRDLKILFFTRFYLNVVVEASVSTDCTLLGRNFRYFQAVLFGRRKKNKRRC